MWPVIGLLAAAVLAVLGVVTVVVLEIRRLHSDVHALKKDVKLLNEENGLTVSTFSVHGIPEMNRWPTPPRLTLRMRARAWWDWIVVRWRRLVNL